MASSLQTGTQSVVDRHNVTDASVTHRRRNLAARPIWQRSDLAVATGASHLAGLTGDALLPVFSVHDPTRGFRTVIERPIELPSSRADAHGLAAEEFLRRHEPWVRQFPDQWRGWKELRPN